MDNTKGLYWLVFEGLVARGKEETKIGEWTEECVRLGPRGGETEEWRERSDGWMYARASCPKRGDDDQIWRDLYLKGDAVIGNCFLLSLTQPRPL